MLSKFLRVPVGRLIQPVGRALASMGISANFLTVMGAVIVWVGAAFVALGRPVVGGMILLGGSSFDFLDGAVAKATGSGSRLGAFLDSTVDRFTDGVVLVAVAWYLVGRTGLGLALALASLVLGFLISYIRARGEGLGVSCHVGIAERAERTILIGAGLVIPPFLIASLAILAAVSLFTALQRFVHVYSQLREAS